MIHHAFRNRDLIVARRLILGSPEDGEIWGAVARKCRRILSQCSVAGCDADDLVQEALIELMERLDGRVARYVDQGPARFAAWLRKLCHDVCVDVCCRHWRRDERRLSIVPPDRLASVPAPPTANELSKSAREAIDLIADERQRRILDDLAHGWTMDEIATRLGLSRSAAYRLLAQARAELAKRFPG